MGCGSGNESQTLADSLDSARIVTIEGVHYYKEDRHSIKLSPGVLHKFKQILTTSPTTGKKCQITPLEVCRGAVPLQKPVQERPHKRKGQLSTTEGTKYMESITDNTKGNA